MKSGHARVRSGLRSGGVVGIFDLCRARPAPEVYSFQNQVHIAERGAAVRASSICSARGCGGAISIMGKARDPSSRALLRRSVHMAGGKMLIGGRKAGYMLGGGANDG